MTAATATRRTARKAADSDGVRGLARLGLVGRGVLYLILAYLVLRLSFGSHAEADKAGALEVLGHNGFGRLAIGVVAVGFAGYAVFRLIEATIRPGERGPVGRVGSFAKCLLYAGLAATTAQHALTHPKGTTDQKSQDVTSRVLGWPAGRALVVAAGAGLVAAGVYNAYRALSGRFRKHLKEHELSQNAGRWVGGLAVAGLLARSLAFTLVGAFFVDAALRYDPERAQGLDGALRRLAGMPMGRPLLLFVAAGFAAYGLWSFAEARYRRVLGG